MDLEGTNSRAGAFMAKTSSRKTYQLISGISHTFYMRLRKSGLTALCKFLSSSGPDPLPSNMANPSAFETGLHRIRGRISKNSGPIRQHMPKNTMKHRVTFMDVLESSSNTRRRIVILSCCYQSAAGHTPMMSTSLAISQRKLADKNSLRALCSS
jgi:hypothetical protein